MKDAVPKKWNIERVIAFTEKIGDVADEMSITPIEMLHAIRDLEVICLRRMIPNKGGFVKTEIWG